jgi:hypothetical protein
VPLSNIQILQPPTRTAAWLISLERTLEALELNRTAAAGPEGVPPSTIEWLRIVMMIRSTLTTRNNGGPHISQTLEDDMIRAFQAIVINGRFSVGTNINWNMLSRVDFDILCAGRRISYFYTRDLPEAGAVPGPGGATPQWFGHIRP